MMIVGILSIITLLCSCLVHPCVMGFLVTSRKGRVLQGLPSTWKRLRNDCIMRHFVTVPSSREVDDTEEAPWYQNMDVLQDENGDDSWYGDDTKEDWIPDAERAKERRKPTHLTPAKEVLGGERQYDEGQSKSQKQDQDPQSPRRTSPYTDEEEALIEALGGKQIKPSKREEGFLGDSTLREVSTDYSVPICYLADVLCMWNVPVPINIHDRLGDLVTGEQAFALVEAIHSLDIGALHDRYSNQNMFQVCGEWNIELKDAFQFAMAEGWSLPFGVRTHLRVEQEDELLRVYSPLYQGRNDENDE